MSLCFNSSKQFADQYAFDLCLNSLLDRIDSIFSELQRK